MYQYKETGFMRQFSTAVTNIFPFISRIGSIGRLVTVLTLWRQRSNSRRKLLSLDENQLIDLGISRAEAEAESRKRFWMP